MITFKQFLKESKQDKNLHLEHLEDEIFNGGVDGTRGAINLLRSLRDMLYSDISNPRINLTTKFDGAPAIVCGTDPLSGKFFVGTKGVFAQTPKLNFTESDIYKNHSGGLVEKLKIALQYLSEIGIKGVLQGDMMYTKSDLMVDIIDNEKCYIFQPNTITYAVPVDSHQGRIIGKSKMGVVFHTSYSGGPTINDMKASFGVNINNLKHTKNVWVENANFIDATGAAKLSSEQSIHITKILSQAGKVFQGIPSNVLNFIATNSSYNLLIKTWNNSVIKTGKPIFNIVTHYNGLLNFITDRYDTEISKLKTESSKQKKTEEKNIVLKWFKTWRTAILDMFQLMNLLSEAKIYILRQLEKVRRIGTFMRTEDGYKVTAPEGFVAIQSGTKALKLVDRLQFSYNNFTIPKNWDR